jgi:hypothetical protein
MNIQKSKTAHLYLIQNYSLFSILFGHHSATSLHNFIVDFKKPTFPDFFLRKMHNLYIMYLKMHNFGHFSNLNTKNLCTYFKKMSHQKSSISPLEIKFSLAQQLTACQSYSFRNSVPFKGHWGGR